MSSATGEAGSIQKGDRVVTTGCHPLEIEAGERSSGEAGTRYDHSDMNRMGKAQEFKVRYLQIFSDRQSEDE